MAGSSGSVATAVRRLIRDSGRSFSTVQGAQSSIALAAAKQLDRLAGDPDADPARVVQLAEKVSALVSRLGVTHDAASGGSEHGELFTDAPR